MNNRNVIRNFFNRLAPDWMDEDELAPVRDEIVRRSALSENRIILDAGCGHGSSSLKHESKPASGAGFV